MIGGENRRRKTLLEEQRRVKEEMQDCGDNGDDSPNRFMRDKEIRRAKGPGGQRRGGFFTEVFKQECLPRNDSRKGGQQVPDDPNIVGSYQKQLEDTYRNGGYPPREAKQACSPYIRDNITERGDPGRNYFTGQHNSHDQVNNYG
jgi:hypothetical protein